jgi:hypothetical protein
MLVAVMSATVAIPTMALERSGPACHTRAPSFGAAKRRVDLAQAAV